VGALLIVVGPGSGGGKADSIVKNDDLIRYGSRQGLRYYRFPVTAVSCPGITSP
jgi:hypothetical protein